MIVTPQGRTLTTCIFDLDDTLYPEACGVMAAIKDRIQTYMIERMSFAPDDVPVLRSRFYERYGTALRGLQLEHTVDAEDYLDFVHDLPIANFVEPAPALDAALEALPLDKVIFTNATAEHAARVLDCLGIRRHFKDIVDLRRFDYYCKPDARAYRRLLELIGQPAEACVFVEDAPRNLRPAVPLGMVTILIDPEGRGGEEFDYYIRTVAEIGTAIERLCAGRDGSPC